jgi:hypothetical protein
VTWTPPDVSDEELAALGWLSSQTALAGAALVGTAQLVSVEWHGTQLDDRLGAYGIVADGGRLEPLVGERVRLTRGLRSCFIYVVDSTDELDADVSVTRRAFLELGDLSAEELLVTLEVVHGSTG